LTLTSRNAKRLTLTSLPGFQPSKNLCDPGPADTEVAGECGPALELAGVEERLVISSQFQRIAGFLGDRPWFGFGLETGIPGKEGDDRRST
jgi:hypothetical protein